MTSATTGPPSALTRMALRHRRRLGALGALGATALAVTWLVVVPEKAGDVGTLQSWLLRYAHSLCWALLAVTAGAWALRAPKPFVEWPARGALVTYLAFLTAFAL